MGNSVKSRLHLRKKKDENRSGKSKHSDHNSDDVTDRLQLRNQPTTSNDSTLNNNTSLPSTGSGARDSPPPPAPTQARSRN